MIFCEVGLEEVPDLPNDWVVEELGDKGSVVVREDIPEYQDPVFA